MTNTNQNLKILAFVGLPGSGKSTAVDYLTEKDIPKVYFGGVILEEMKNAGIEQNQENERLFREDVRQKYGKDFVVQKIIEQINKLVESGQHKIVADGLYSWTEYKVLKKAFPGELVLVAIVAPKHHRYHRLSIRPVRPLTRQEAEERDWAEIENLEKGGPIAISDHYIINDGNIEQLHQKIEDLIEEIEF